MTARVRPRGPARAGAAGAAAVLLLACVGPGGGPSPEDAGPGADAGAPDAGWTRTGTVTVRIGTWNLEQFPKTGTTARAVSELLGALDADVLGIQEITEPAAFEALLARLPAYEGAQVEDPGNFLRVGLMYRSDRVRLVEMGTLFEGDDYAFPRPPLWARLEALDHRGRVTFDFIVVVLHLKAQTDSRSVARRREACRRLEAWVTADSAGADEQDYVLVGDWNDRLTRNVDDNVFRPFLESPDRYRFLTRPLAEEGVSSYIPIPGLIDHVMVTTDALFEYGPGTTRVVEAENLFPTYGRDVSDHRPVVSTFVVR